MAPEKMIPREVLEKIGDLFNELAIRGIPMYTDKKDDGPMEPPPEVSSE